MFKQFRQWWQKKRINNIIYGIILGVMSSLIAAAIAANYPAITEPIHKFILANLGWLIAFIILVIITIGIILYYVNALRRDRGTWEKNLADLNTKLDTLTSNLGWGDHLVEIVNSLLSRLPELIATRDLHSFMHDLLAEATRAVTKLVPGVYGGSLYRPEGKDYLKIWEAYQVPEDSRKNAICYIGPKTDIKRGVAGECFCERTTLVAHKTNQIDKNQDWVFDKENYLHFGRHGTHPAFEAFICVPVTTNDDSCLGVLCLDSGNLTAFDNIALQKTLQQLAQIIAWVTIFYEELEKMQTKEM